ncbi:hypothetical protein [Bacillus sp. Hm123]|uniref:hypothetical protein n=1 Tax=Bacillus sp. Hm123 TaxID=3450745 RepID=UPI003F43C079
MSNLSEKKPLLKGLFIRRLELSTATAATATTTTIAATTKAIRTTETIKAVRATKTIEAIKAIKTAKATKTAEKNSKLAILMIPRDSLIRLKISNIQHLKIILEIIHISFLRI